MPADYFFLFIAVVIAAALVIAFLQKYYCKVGADFALLRTGFLGRKIVLSGGCLYLPFLHTVEKVPMGGMGLSITGEGRRAFLSGDLIAIDAVARATRAVGAVNINSDDLLRLFGGHLVDAAQAEIAKRTLVELHENRSQFTADMKKRLEPGFAEVGLVLHDVSLTQMRQSPISEQDVDANIFHSEGARRTVQIISENRKKRALIETETEVAVKQTELERTQKSLDMEKRRQEAEIALKENIARLQSESDSRTQSAAEQSLRETELAKLERENELRRQEIRALQEIESAKVDGQVATINKRKREVSASAELELSKLEVVRAQEKVQAERESLAMKRAQDIAAMKSRGDSAIQREKTESDAADMLKTEEANARVEALRAQTRAATLKVEAEGEAKMIAAENAMNEQVVELHMQKQKLRALPKLVKLASKPLEKIESIRINHVGGVGGSNKPGDSVAEAMNDILAMSVQLPVVKKLGEQAGLEVDTALATRVSDAKSRRNQAARKPRNGNHAGAKDAADKPHDA